MTLDVGEALTPNKPNQTVMVGPVSTKPFGTRQKRWTGDKSAQWARA